MLSLFLRNLFFTILQPGVVAVLIPWLLLRKNPGWGFSVGTIWNQISGFSIFVAGAMITLICITSFAVYGRGTLSPADPTKKLVTRGLYRFSRNPMYVGVMLMLAGETIFFLSLKLLIYSLLVCTAFVLFVRLREEPRLTRDFGDAYLRYTKKVRRWF